MRLSREIRTVTDPHRERPRSEQDARLDAVDVVSHRLRANRGIGVREAAVFVRERLSRLILEGVRVHRVEPESERGAVFPEPLVVVGAIPGQVQRHRRSCGGQLVNDRAVLELFEYVSRLAQAREPAEACAAGAHTPGRNRHLEIGHRTRDVIDPDAAALELRAESGIVAGKCGGVQLVSRRDVARVTRIGVVHRFP